MSTIKPGDVMLTKSCRMVRVLASRDDGAVAMRDYRSRVAVRSVDTDRLSYHSEHELTLVQPPATPQEPEQPVKGYTLQGLSNYFGWGLRDDRAIWRFIHERESLLRLCQSLLGTEKSKAQTAELAIRERIEQLSTPSPEGQTWCFSEAELRLLVEGVGRLPSFTPERRALQDSLTERLSRALLPSPPTPEGTQP